ncbi:coiled-coil domain-containing protein 9-like isoform X2 [Sinocyclocheilus rhinocerous]|uniref:coiled-coil domain-containing protein 9-like isoform X2 n=1 Tax=Sinocyclocheilus rhinocerous TaxID=307959 RepID=UPI0007B8871C|nr:PREDICTED: coiled-coil domain-containing protein 9-like isoform X2 [Sinocyclocheilus rhinocerous]
MSAVVDLKTKEEKDAELDKRIEALRKKNEALVKRYQEIQEDKKKAEQEGIAVTTTRKPRPHEPESERRKTETENVTVTVDLSKPVGEKRGVNDRKPAAHRGDQGPEEEESGRPHGESPPHRTGSGRLSRGGHHSGRREPRSNKGEPWSERQPQDGEGGEGPARSERSSRGGQRGGRGGGGTQGGSGSDRKSKEWEEKRRQNIEKMNEEMEKIAEYERGQRADGEKNPIRNFLDDPRRSGPIPETDRKEGSRRHVRNWGGVDFDSVKTGAEVEKEWTNRRPSGKGSVDMTLSMTGRERAEYLRWKKEREQIDEERLARHRNATGQWRREWDAQKTDTMFKEDSAVSGEGTQEQSNRREDSKPPKAPTFGDFLGQGKPRQGGRGRGKGHGQGKSYSMHDNRWEGENEEEKGRKEEQEKEKDEEKVKEKEDENKDDTLKAPLSDKKTDGGLAEEDDDEWEDASDGEEEDVEEDEKAVHEEDSKDAKPTEKTPTSPAPSTPSPKEQRTPRPKVYIPSPQETLSTPEGPKPLSPFSPLDGHQPVSDWGEEMEMLSPKISLAESPLRPSSTESSPAQPKSNPAEHNMTTTPSQPEEPESKESTSTVVESASCETPKEPVPAESADTTTSSSHGTADPVLPPTPDSANQSKESNDPIVEPDQSRPETKVVEDMAVDSSDQPSSG